MECYVDFVFDIQSWFWVLYSVSVLSAKSHVFCVRSLRFAYLYYILSGV